MKPSLKINSIELTPGGFCISWDADLVKMDFRRAEAKWTELLTEAPDIKEMVPVSAAGLLESQGQTVMARQVGADSLVMLVDGFPWKGGDCPQVLGGVGELEWEARQVCGDWFPSKEASRIRRGLRNDGMERGERLLLWDEKGRWMPRGVTLVRAFMSLWEREAGMDWVVALGRDLHQEHLEMLAGGEGRLAQWGNLYRSTIVTATISCSPSQLQQELIHQLRSIVTTIRILGLECTALIHTPKLRRDIQAALKRVGIGCESEDQGVALPSITLFLRDRFGREFEGPQLRIQGDVNQMAILVRWQGPLSQLVSALLEQGPLPQQLTPEQVRILPVADGDCQTAEGYLRQCLDADVRANLVAPDQPLAQRIVEASRLEIPSILVIGERERQQETVSLRRAGQQKQIQFSSWLAEEIAVAHQ